MMRVALILVLPLLLGISVTPAPAADARNWDQWRSLPVLDSGRYKPFDTLAREVLQTITAERSIRDPDSSTPLDPVAAYLRMVFDWHLSSDVRDLSDELPIADLYFGAHEADAWDRERLFHIDNVWLRRALDVDENVREISAWELYHTQFRDPRTGHSVPFVTWAERAARADAPTPSNLIESGNQLASKFRLYLGHRMGVGLLVVPAPSSPGRWLSVFDLWNERYDDSSDPTGALRQCQEKLRRVTAAYRQPSASALNDASAEFIDWVTETGPALGPYPRPSVIELELAYNRWKPFRIAWLLSCASLLLLVIGAATWRRALYYCSFAVFCAGLMALLVGLGLRVAIAGRAPVTNMYESVVFTGLGVGILGLVLEIKWRKGLVLGAAAAIVTLLLLVADRFPAVLSPAITPLPSALRSNFWLVTHVLTTVVSYSAYALGLAIGNITLGHYLVRSQNWFRIDALGAATLWCLRFGTVMLAIGTVTGGIWADYSWGRFWGWDPKEVWALVTLLGYLGLLHAYRVRWVGRFGLAALSVMSFSMVVIAWYGVNYVLGSGLHSYGGGRGGLSLVLIALFVQFAYVAIAAARNPGDSNPGQES